MAKEIVGDIVTTEVAITVGVEKYYCENKKQKSVIFKCYSSEKFIALTPFTRLSTPGTHFAA